MIGLAAAFERRIVGQHMIFPVGWSAPVILREAHRRLQEGSCVGPHALAQELFEDVVESGQLAHRSPERDPSRIRPLAYVAWLS